jgi:hypothetical protein
MNDVINNKVEVLRALERTKAQVDELISNLDAIGTFTDKDKEFLEEFKKIYHIGLSQLYRFIDKLDEQGKDLDPTTIIYYKRILLNGPLTNFVTAYVTKNNTTKKYWKFYSDVMGVMGNLNKSSTSVPVWVLVPGDIPIPVDTYNKLPGFMQDSLTEQTANVNSVFGFNFASVVVNDNTLPFIDKEPTIRMYNEYGPGHDKQPHANYVVKDIEFYKGIEAVSADIFKSVESTLGTDDDFRLYKYEKTTNPFSEDNVSTSGNTVVARKLTYPVGNTDREVDIATDLFGNQFESEEKMKFALKIIAEEKDKEFALYTVEGQLGSGDKPKSEPIGD